MKTARLRGYDPTTSLLIKKEYVMNAPCLGRPRIATSDVKSWILEAGNILYLSNK